MAWACLFQFRSICLPAEYDSVWCMGQGLSAGQRSPGLFACGEMGVLNYVVHTMAQRNELRIAMSDLQHMGGHHDANELKQDYAESNWHFRKIIPRPRIAHICGHKPLLFDGETYSRLFTIARLKRHRGQHCELGAWLAVLNEERHEFARKVQRRFERAVRGWV